MGRSNVKMLGIATCYMLPLLVLVAPPNLWIASVRLNSWMCGHDPKYPLRSPGFACLTVPVDLGNSQRPHVGIRACLCACEHVLQCARARPEGRRRMAIEHGSAKSDAHERNRPWAHRGDHAGQRDDVPALRLVAVSCAAHAHSQMEMYKDVGPRNARAPPQECPPPQPIWREHLVGVKPMANFAEACLRNAPRTTSTVVWTGPESRDPRPATGPEQPTSMLTS